MGISVVFISNIDLIPYLNDSLQVDVVAIHLYELENRTYELSRAQIVVVCINFEQLYPDITNRLEANNLLATDICSNTLSFCKRILNLVRMNTNAKIIWFGFEDYYSNNTCVFGSTFRDCGIIDLLNLEMFKLLQDDIFVDLKYIIAQIGIANSYDTKGKYRWNNPYSRELVEAMIDEIVKHHLISTKQTKKCVVLDCDNVLWGGIVAEDGIGGIVIGKNGNGKPYHDFQEFILTLYNHGVIIALCSKNDSDLILDVFINHSEMVLRTEHISCIMANWDDKSCNIQKISKILNIDLNSIVFVDDSLYELKEVNCNLPEVTTILFDKYRWQSYFRCFNLCITPDLENAKKRTKSYQSDTLRSELLNKSLDNEDYINSLEMTIEIHEAVPAEFKRISELSQKTNKCSNGKRYSLEEIKQHSQMLGCTLYAVYMSDKFSDFGLIGAMEIIDDRLSMFALSCRALGRKLEHNMLDFLNNQDHSVNSFEFINTSKNNMLWSLLCKRYSGNK